MSRAYQITCSLLVLTGLLLTATGCEESRAPAASSAPASSASHEKPTDATPSDNQSTPTSAAPAEVEQAKPAAEIPAKSPTPAGTRDITFDTIKFPLEKNEQYDRSKLTPAIEALNGHDVRLRGYILPSFQQSGITQFVLVRDNMQCCFGPGAALYDCVVVDMKPGKTTDFTVRPVAVEGKFELRDFKGPDDKYLAIYHLDGEAVSF